MFVLVGVAAALGVGAAVIIYWFIRSEGKRMNQLENLKGTVDDVYKVNNAIADPDSLKRVRDKYQRD
jgi:hypothetical protein